MYMPQDFFTFDTQNNYYILKFKKG